MRTHTGRRSIQTRLVEPSASSLNSGDVFVAVANKKLVHWIGKSANIIEKARVSRPHISIRYDVNMRNILESEPLITMLLIFATVCLYSGDIVIRSCVYASHPHRAPMWWWGSCTKRSLVAMPPLQLSSKKRRGLSMRIQRRVMTFGRCWEGRKELNVNCSLFFSHY